MSGGARTLTFLTPEHPTPVRAPAVALGVSVAPLRFTQNGLQLSLLELGVGAGTELPGLGLESPNRSRLTVGWLARACMRLSAAG